MEGVVHTPLNEVEDEESDDRLKDERPAEGMSNIKVDSILPAKLRQLGIDLGQH